MSTSRQNGFDSSSGQGKSGGGTGSASAVLAQRDALGRLLVECFDELDEITAQLQHAREEMECLQRSRGFRMLTALSAARKSFAGACALPAGLWQALRSPPLESPRPADLITDAGALVKRPARDGLCRPVRILAIVDEFTEQCFGGECELWMPGPATDVSQLAGCEFDFLFVESAWVGNGGRWRDQLHADSHAFLRLLTHVRSRAIPTIFWNKEDPVHFEHFLPLARHFDWVLTTAHESVAGYVQALASKQVAVMPFACQPVLHNPIGSVERKWAAMFAGSYYAKYPERNAALLDLIDSCRNLMVVDIFDRNLHSDNPELAFPSELVGLVRGGLKPTEIGDAYRGYRFAINVNTVTLSATMLSRRVFELLGSGAVVISNHSMATERLFGELVIAGKTDEVISRVEALLDPLEWDRHALCGLRKVLQEHTWQHRVRGLCGMLGIDGILQDEPQIWAVCPVSSVLEIKQALAHAVWQTQAAKVVLVAASDLLIEDVSLLPWVEIISEHAAAQTVVPHDALLAGWSPSAWYGPNYLLDLRLGLSFGAADGVGKAAYWQAGDAGSASLQGADQKYRRVAALAPSRALVRNASRWFGSVAEIAKAVRSGRLIEGDFHSLDYFNYCIGMDAPPDCAVDASRPIDVGVSLQEFLGNASAETLPFRYMNSGLR